MVHAVTLEEEVDPDLPLSAQFTIPKNLPIPRIQRPSGVSDENYCRFDLDSEKIEIFVKDHYTEILCSISQGGISTNRHWRMIEAIEFAIG
jgi:hypothetical protein